MELIRAFIRSALYILTGIACSYGGWFVGQIILTDLRLREVLTGSTSLLAEKLIIFTLVAVFLSAGIVCTEIITSMPGRNKLIQRILPMPLKMAAGCGLILGLASGFLYSSLSAANQFPVPLIRVLSWALIGAVAGLSESIAWAGSFMLTRRKIDSTVINRFTARVVKSGCAATLSGGGAGLLFEFVQTTLLRNNSQWQDPIGLIMLGGLLGIFLSIATSPSNIVALRAGAGFENMNDQKFKGEINTSRLVDQLKLGFADKPNDVRILEGRSIQLPDNGDIIIGSTQNYDAHIKIEGIPITAAKLTINNRRAVIRPTEMGCNKVKVDATVLETE